MIEAFVEKIVVSQHGFDWYLRFDGDPDKPLHCTLQGKRRTTTKIMVSGENSPTMDKSATGCYQGLISPKTTPRLSGRGVFSCTVFPGAALGVRFVGGGFRQIAYFQAASFVGSVTQILEIVSVLFFGKMVYC